MVWESQTMAIFENAALKPVRVKMPRRRQERTAELSGNSNEEFDLICDNGLKPTDSDTAIFGLDLNHVAEELGCNRVLEASGPQGIGYEFRRLGDELASRWINEEIFKLCPGCAKKSSIEVLEDFCQFPTSVSLEEPFGSSVSKDKILTKIKTPSSIEGQYLGFS